MFDRQKAGALQKLAYARDKNKVDLPALPLLKIINSKKDLFTSSSCYGRILLIDFIGIKGKSKFLGCWHRPVSFSEVKKCLRNAKGKQIWLRAEPLILHVSCRNLDAAKKVLNIKNKLCIKRGGIFHIADKPTKSAAVSTDSRVQIELEGTQRMEALVKVDSKPIVSDVHLKLLVAIANKRFRENEKDWQAVEKEFWAFR